MIVFLWFIFILLSVLKFILPDIPRCRTIVVLLFRKKEGILIAYQPLELVFQNQFFKVLFDRNLRSRLNILVEMMALPKTVFSIPNLTVSFLEVLAKSIYKNELLLI